MILAKKSKVNLPKDWIVVNSTSFPDRVYYFNVRTGKSSWKEPLHDSVKEATLARKRKIEVNEQEEVSSEKMRSPNSTPNSAERRLLQAKRTSAPANMVETPQMASVRKKMLEKKRKSTSNVNLTSTAIHDGENNNNKISSSTVPLGKRGKITPRKRYSKLNPGVVSKQLDALCDAKSTPSSQTLTVQNTVQSNLSVSSESSTTFVPSVRKIIGIQPGKGEQAIQTPKSSTSRSSSGRKNLANTRLSNLKKALIAETKKIEPAVTAKLVRRLLGQNSELDKNAENILKDTKNAPSSTQRVPNIYQNTESRFKALRARLTKNSTLPSATSKDKNESNKAAVKLPKKPKNNKKLKQNTLKANAVSAAVAETHVSKQADTSKEITVPENYRELFWEEMEWEPIEEEKVVVEIQEVRMQISSDQSALNQKLLNYTTNGLELSKASENTDKPIVYIVVDTNVFLSNLKTITEVLDDAGKDTGYYRPILVVPWTVLQELDYIKDNKAKRKSVHLQRSAKTAVAMLFQYFSSKHPRLKGQTAADAAANRAKFQVESPDDEILQSCLQIRDFGCAVVLLSNDKNLCNKAIIHNIPTYGRHESIQDMLLLNTTKDPSSNSKDCVKLKDTIESKKENIKEEEAEISDDIFSEAKAIVKHFLSTIVSNEMKNLYGENWEKYTIVKPPWSVMDVLKCTSKHWIAAISDVFVRQAGPLVTRISTMFQNAPKYGQSLRYVGDVLDTCHDLVQMVKSDQYRELSENTCHSIKDLIDTCREKLQYLQKDEGRTVLDRDNNNLDIEQRSNKAFDYFEQIWMFTNNFCGFAADLTGIPHTITYKNFDPAPTPEIVYRMQPELVSSLNQLIDALRAVLNEDGNLTVSHPALLALYHRLVNYMPNSGELDDSRLLDLEDLLCCINTKKEILRSGLVQLQELSYQFCRMAGVRSTSTVVAN